MICDYAHSDLEKFENKTFIKVNCEDYNPHHRLNNKSNLMDANKSHSIQKKYQEMID